MARFSKAFLYRLRNQIPVAAVIQRVLDLPYKEVDGILRFLCPWCHEFNTAIHPRENLGRCFRCRRNFNPIDLVIAYQACDFREAINLLKPWLPQKALSSDSRRLP